MKRIITALALSLIFCGASNSTKADSISEETTSSSILAGKFSLKELPNDVELDDVTWKLQNKPAPAGSQVFTLPPSPIDLATIINLGLKAWEIIKENAPTEKFQNYSANALPKGVENWQDLENWKDGAVKTYLMTFNNGIYTPVQFKFRVRYSYNGDYKGKGKYLEYLTIEPALVHVSWGHHFDASVAVPQVMNAGTLKDPIASAEISVTWTVSSVFASNQSSASFLVRGDGSFKNITGKAITGKNTNTHE